MKGPETMTRQTQQQTIRHLAALRAHFTRAMREHDATPARQRKARQLLVSRMAEFADAIDKAERKLPASMRRG
jgi:hypothetical protein